MKKYDVYKNVRQYLESDYGAYSLEDIGNQRKFSIGWSSKDANNIHSRLVNDFNFKMNVCKKGEYTWYSHDSGLEIAIYLDKTQAPARYYVQFGWLL